MGAHQDSVQRAVVLAVAMICAGLYGTLDTFICMTIHKITSFNIWYNGSMTQKEKTIQETLSILDNLIFLCYDILENIWDIPFKIQEK